MVYTSLTNDKSKSFIITCWILYGVSLLIFIVAGCIGLIFFNKGKWLITFPYNDFSLFNPYPHFTPLSIFPTVLTIFTSILIALSIIIFIIILLKNSVIKDELFYKTLFSIFPMLAVIAVMLDGFLLLLGVLIPSKKLENEKTQNTADIASSIISGLAAILLILAYIKTEFQGSIKGFIVKKLFFSVLFLFNLYCFFYEISRLFINFTDRPHSILSRRLAFSLAFGLTLSLTTILGTALSKNLGMGIIGILINAGILDKAIKWAKEEKFLEFFKIYKWNLSDLIMSSISIGFISVTIVVTVVLTFKKNKKDLL